MKSEWAVFNIFAMAAINVFVALLPNNDIPCVNWAAAVFIFGLGIATAINERR